MSMPDTMDPLPASLFRRLTARYTGVTLLPLPTTGSSILIKRKPQKTQNLKRQYADQATSGNECTCTMNSLPHLGSCATYFTCTGSRHQLRSPTHNSATRTSLVGVHLATILSLEDDSSAPAMLSRSSLWHCQSAIPRHIHTHRRQSFAAQDTPISYTRACTSSPSRVSSCLVSGWLMVCYHLIKHVHNRSGSSISRIANPIRSSPHCSLRCTIRTLPCMAVGLHIRIIFCSYRHALVHFVITGGQRHRGSQAANASTCGHWLLHILLLHIMSNFLAHRSRKYDGAPHNSGACFPSSTASHLLWMLTPLSDASYSTSRVDASS
jgi:hypothetical protein